MITNFLPPLPLTRLPSFRSNPPNSPQNTASPPSLPSTTPPPSFLLRLCLGLLLHCPASAFASSPTFALASPPSFFPSAPRNFLTASASSPTLAIPFFLFFLCVAHLLHFLRLLPHPCHPLIPSSPLHHSPLLPHLPPSPPSPSPPSSFPTSPTSPITSSPAPSPLPPLIPFFPLGRSHPLLPPLSPPPLSFPHTSPTACAPPPPFLLPPLLPPSPLRRPHPSLPPPLPLAFSSPPHFLHPPCSLFQPPTPPLCLSKRSLAARKERPGDGREFFDDNDNENTSDNSDDITRLELGSTSVLVLPPPLVLPSNMSFVILCYSHSSFTPPLPRQLELCHSLLSCDCTKHNYSKLKGVICKK